MDFGTYRVKWNIMKTINNYFGKNILLVFFLFLGSAAFAQNKESDIKKSVESKSFIFHAQTALPLSGSTRQLTSDYDLKVSENSITSYLPFFGRAYSVNYGSTNGGFEFTSTKFDYSSEPRKKGGWEISIKPKDVQDFKEFFLTLSSDGYGTLQAISNNRQAISFNGYITPK